jgi:nitrogen regulatory protein PII
VLFTGIPGIVRGAIEVEVNASNMSMPFVSRVPVEILVKDESTSEVARELIGKLKVGTKFRLGISEAE